MSKLPENTEIKLKKGFLSTGVIKLLAKIVIILSILMATIGTISVFFLQNTIMQVDFKGDSASGHLHAGKIYEIVCFGECNATICLYYDSKEIFRSEAQSVPGYYGITKEEDRTEIVSIRVDRSAEYTLLLLEGSGRIAIQEWLVPSLLGMDADSAIPIFMLGSIFTFFCGLSLLNPEWEMWRKSRLQESFLSIKFYKLLIIMFGLAALYFLLSFLFNPPLTLHS